jgi:aspartyl protease family protein
MIFKRPLYWAIWIVISASISALRLVPQLSDMSGQSAANTSSTTAKAKPPEHAMLAKPAGPRLVSIAADSKGHHTVFASIDGVRVRMLVDTGASIVTLTMSDALNLGLKPKPEDFKVPFNTANGRVHGARVLLPMLGIGEITIDRVEAVILPREALSVSLLGQSFLKRLSGYEMAQGRLILKS